MIYFVVQAFQTSRRSRSFFKVLFRATKFVLNISSPVTILLGNFSLKLLFAFKAQLCMARNMLEKSKDVLSSG